MERAEGNYEERRTRVFLILAGLFLGSMAMLNILGLTRFIEIGPLRLAVGVLPYPITFLCTDLISELYGKKRASFVVWVGFLVNIFVIGFVWLGNALPAVPAADQPPWQTLDLSEPVRLLTGETVDQKVELFHIIYTCTAGSVIASMVAYLSAQLCDVHVFHFWKRVTKGKHLWLRNNGSTLVSQFVDSIMVIGITFGAALIGGDIAVATFLTFLFSNYLFKMTAALLDTIPFYIGVRTLSKYLGIKP